MAEPDKGLVVVFKDHPILNDAKSKEAGRPIFDSMEICEIRFAGDRNRISPFPAHDFTQYEIDEDGTPRRVTYAERFSKQYQRFKRQQTQVKEGTPLEELPFLSAAKRSELKGLNIYTAEDLAAVEGQALKSLGMEGRKIKTQAEAYIANASDSSLATRQAEEIASLRQQIAAMKGDQEVFAAANPTVALAEPAAASSEFDTLSDADLKEYIKTETGSAPRGTPSRETLVRMAEEAKQASE